MIPAAARVARGASQGVRLGRVKFSIVSPASLSPSASAPEPLYTASATSVGAVAMARGVVVGTAPSTSAGVLDRVPQRSFASDGKPPEDLKPMVEEAIAETAEKVNELVEAYGESRPEQQWVTNYYRNPKPDMLVAVLASASKNDRDPVMDARIVQFLASAIRKLPDEVFTQIAFRIFTTEVSMDLSLPLLHQIGTPAGDKAIEGMQGAMEKMGNSEIADFVKRLRNTPTTPVLEWPLPSSAEFRDSWTAPNGVYEFMPNMVAVKEACLAGDSPNWHDWALVSSYVLVESLWAHFFATGEEQYIVRILSLAAPWSEYEHREGVTLDHLLRMDTPLPDSLRVTEEDSVRSQVARVAMSSMLFNAARQPTVVRILAASVAETADSLVLPGHADDPAALEALPEESMQALMAKTSVVPTLLHLLSIIRRDYDAAEE